MTLRRLFPLALIVLLASNAFSADRRRASRQTDVPTITIGGLFSLTGDGATLGRASKATLEFAERAINGEFAALGIPQRVGILVLDTQLQPFVALEKLKELDAHGVTFVIGPQSSAEAQALVKYATDHDMYLISQGSTASGLSIGGDRLFRLAPNDRLEGRAIAALMKADGIDTMLSIYRDDGGNSGLFVSTKRMFEGNAGPGVGYQPTETDFRGAVTELGNNVRLFKTQNPNAHIGIYIASFEEAAAIFELARLDPDLASLRWYGGDGITQSQAVLANANAAQFAAMTSFTAPNISLDGACEDAEELTFVIELFTGYKPDAFALSVYDAAWIAALSSVEAEARPDQLERAFLRNIEHYCGATGPTTIDTSGDRKTGNFDFWTVRDDNGQPAWTRTAQFLSGHVVR